ncbi:DNA-processing protein DprA [soil metagenome]
MIAEAALVRQLLAAGVLPNDVARVRSRLGLCAPPAAVITELRRTVGSRLLASGVEGGRMPARSDGRDRLLVAGQSLPVLLEQSWEAGGPLWVHWRGALPCEGARVGIVGTRRPTADGLALAGLLAHDLAMAGVTVVSGMARGIDQAAHRGALQAGGSTIAVLGAGLDIDYPAGAGSLRQAVADAGGLVSEYPHDHGIRHRRQFTARNRILAGLCHAVVVIEAGTRSGALNSATWAMTFDREVLVVPSSPTNPAAAGALALLFDGAVPVRDAADVLGVLGIQAAAVPEAPAGGGPVRQGAAPDATAARVLELLSPVPSTPSALAEVTGLSPRQVLVALSQLEDAGQAIRTGGGVMRAPLRRR